MSVIQRTPAPSSGGGGVSFAEIEAHEFKHVQSVVTAPAPSGGDDSKAVEESYEELGKAGIVQLRNGTYKFDAGAKFRKYAVWLRGMGASSMEVESKIVTAGTLITCNSRNKTAIECSQSGSAFSDFALLNNANLELGTLSEALSSSGAAIEKLPVNALAEAIPNGTTVTTNSGPGPFELGTLNKEIKTTEEPTELTVVALTGAIPANQAEGKATKITLTSGAEKQVWTLTAGAASGATKLKVTKQKPNFNYPVGTKLEAGKFIQQWTMTAEAKAAATEIKVTSQKPNFSYAATTTKVEGGPFEGSNGINITRLNAAGEEKTEGNSRGRYMNIDIEGFYVNFKQIAGFECRFNMCTFNGAVKYQFQYGDPNNTDAGGLFIDNCAFIGTKRNRSSSYFRWESGGGVFINNCSFVFAPENGAFLPEVCADFFFVPGKAAGTTNLTVNATHVEGFEKGGIRFSAKPPATGLANLAVAGCEIRAFSSTVGRTCILAESEATGVMKATTFSGNRFDAEGGTDILLKNVTEYNNAGNVVLGGADTYFLAEGTSTGSLTGYPSPIKTPEAFTFSKLEKASTSQNVLITLFAEGMSGGEELHWEVKIGGTTILTPKYTAAPPPLYGSLSAEITAGTKVTALTVKPLFTAIPNGTTVVLLNPSGHLLNEEFVTVGTTYGTLKTEVKDGEKVKELKTNALTAAIPISTIFILKNNRGFREEFVTTAEAKVGEEVVKVTEKEARAAFPVTTSTLISPELTEAGATEVKVVEKEAANALASGTAVAYEAGVEGFVYTLPTILLVAGTTFEVVRLDKGELGRGYKQRVTKQSVT